MPIIISVSTEKSAGIHIRKRQKLNVLASLRFYRSRQISPLVRTWYALPVIARCSEKKTLKGWVSDSRRAAAPVEVDKNPESVDNRQAGIRHSDNLTFGVLVESIALCTGVRTQLPWYGNILSRGGKPFGYWNFRLLQHDAFVSSFKLSHWGPALASSHWYRYFGVNRGDYIFFSEHIVQ